MDSQLDTALDAPLRRQLVDGIREGSIVPYLGPGVLADVVNPATGEAMPASGEQLILALNGGKPMAPKLMYEFPRAAMNVELKRGRSAITRFLNATYGETSWSRSALHDWLKGIRPPYVIDINRDTQLLDSYQGTPHLLIQGCARIAGSDCRYALFQSNGDTYEAVAPDSADPKLPILFKPMGTPRPLANYVASDADYVDYVTELMGGFAIPPFLKARRKEKRYLLLGLRLNRDTERMILSDLVYGAGTPTGWALIDDANDKERRFLERIGFTLVKADFRELIDHSIQAVVSRENELSETVP